MNLSVGIDSGAKAEIRNVDPRFTTGTCKALLSAIGIWVHSKSILTDEVFDSSHFWLKHHFSQTCCCFRARPRFGCFIFALGKTSRHATAGETDFGQSRFGHPDLTNLVNPIWANPFLTIFVLATANFWPKPILANPILANPILADPLSLQVCCGSLY